MIYLFALLALAGWGVVLWLYFRPRTEWIMFQPECDCEDCPNRE
jgi:hypothetical protein